MEATRSDGRPTRRLFQAQYRRNPSRCHRTIVSGRNAITFLRQLSTNRAKVIQNKRSVVLGRARHPACFIMAICCRRARFSNASTRCDFIDEQSDTNSAEIHENFVVAMLKPARKKSISSIRSSHRRNRSSDLYKLSPISHKEY
jgi:hypothetical protein